ncbi:ATP-binding protein [Actinoplanes sp. TBRC 11911]|nr:ATP-binding protein [Actinoplanes sp. TBRC 11911]
MREPAEIAYSQPQDLALVRRFVRTEAHRLGLSPARADLLTIAVSELATNTLQHTGGGGRVRVWELDGRVECEVIDGGKPREFGRAMPDAREPRGRGLAIVERVCDGVTVSDADDGTHVRLTMIR